MYENQPHVKASPKAVAREAQQAGSEGQKLCLAREAILMRSKLGLEIEP